MTVFISYSHADSDFVDHLALGLVKARAHVWIDKWELKVGDSLIQRVQAAIEKATALVVVLSKASVESEWCKKELTAGLLRELEERRVLVLPILVERCDIPLFLRDKVYADFRDDFDKGFRQVLSAVARVASDDRGRFVTDDITTDWAMDYGVMDYGKFGAVPMMQFTFVQQARAADHSVLIVVQGFPNKVAAARNAEYAKAGLDWVGHHVAAEFIAEAAAAHDLRIMLSDKTPATQRFGVRDKKLAFQIECAVTCRLLGNDPGNDLLIDVAGLLSTACEHMRLASRPLSESEQRAVAQVMSKPPRA